MSSMRMPRAAALACTVSLLAISAAGCSSVVPPDVSAMVKLATGKIDTLTGPEVQSLTDSPLIAAYAPDLELTDEQAAAIAQFLADNHIATMFDLEALIGRAMTDPTSIVLPDGFFELFKDFQLPTTQQPQ